MVCATRSFEALYSRMQPIDVPSPERIGQLTLEIRNNWSPQTRASRAAVGTQRLEFILAQLRSREQRIQNHFRG